MFYLQAIPRKNVLSTSNTKEERPIYKQCKGKMSDLQAILRKTVLSTKLIFYTAHNTSNFHEVINTPHNNTTLKSEVYKLI